MNLFINAVSSMWSIILFDSNRQIVCRQNIEVLLNESSKLLEEIESFMDKNDIVYDKLDNIVVVNWPWSFTGLRTIALIVNTISYITKKNITPISFFDLFDRYPIVKSSSKRDVFIQKDKSSKIEIILNTECEEYVNSNNIENIYWDLSNNFFTVSSLFGEIDYENIIKNLKFDSKKIIKPLYIKKPNIS